VRKSDYLAAGENFHRRGRRSEEQFALLRRLWAGKCCRRTPVRSAPASDPAVRKCSSAATCRQLPRASAMGRWLYGAGRRRAASDAKNVA
jgi:alkanesulfonate monooxygenase SsuD/methylene tetrahydromethanopterin reductase-like flavin-dependent oxidoreductase (luciferase family)